MHIYKDHSSSAFSKRKAENIGDTSESEQEDKPIYGRQTKKAKPTCGYVSGTGGPYGGTARDNQIPPPPGPARALGTKSTNALLKNREKLAKQDTKNLNRNAPKPKGPYAVGDSSPCHVPLTNTVGVQGTEPTNSESTNPEPSQSGGARSDGRGRCRPS